MYQEERPEPVNITKITVASLAGVLIIITIMLVGCPSYSVYSAKKAGEAVLAHAQSSREVAVAEAKAKMESAALLAQADTIRAHGVARSNAIIGQSLKNNEAYLYWLWVDNMSKNDHEVIYIPTEANMPILEAGRGKGLNTLPIAPPAQ